MIKTSYHRIILVCLMLISTFTWAQNNGGRFKRQTRTDQNERLAMQYYNKQEYEKAYELFVKLQEKHGADKYYDYALSCLMELQDHERAEKLVRKRIKKHDEKVSLYVDLGKVQLEKGESGKSEQSFSKAIKNVMPLADEVIGLANKFLSYKLTDQAINTYLRGRKENKGGYPFSFELAEVYESVGKIPQMVGEYLDVLEFSSEYFTKVQGALTTTVINSSSEKRKEYLRSELLKRVQKNPDKEVYAEMLIWLLVHEKNFTAAFVQVKALDKRLKEDGSRVMNLASEALADEQYPTAIKAYKYVISKGKDNFNYYSAKINLVKAWEAKITSDSFTDDDIAGLDELYNSTLSELGENAQTIDLMRDRAHLKAFYQRDSDGAVELLKRALEVPRAQAMKVAECKLELADILVLKDEIWDASLYYGQVESDFKHGLLGHEAKFRQARVYYYTGNFGWAKGRLDILKASTSKLIANDAMKLSLLIGDNLNTDTTEVPLRMFAEAQLYAYQFQDSMALVKLDSLNDQFPGNGLIDESGFLRAQIAIRAQDYEQAEKYLENVVLFADILADEALFLWAELQEKRLNNPEKAKELYKKLLFDYPGSVLTVQARKRYRRLRGDKI